MSNIQSVTTDAELQAQFEERNKNLKESLSGVKDTIDQVTAKTQDFLKDNAPQEIKQQPIQTSNQDFGMTVADQSLMNNIRHDIQGMNSTNPEVTKDVSSKLEDTFAHNALP